MRVIGNWSDLGQAPSFRQRRELALVAIGIGAIASASVVLALVDLTSKKSDVSFVSGRAIVTNTAPSPSSLGPNDKAMPVKTPDIPLQFSGRAAAPIDPRIGEARQKIDAWNQRDWWKGNRHTEHAAPIGNTLRVFARCLGARFPANGD